MKTILQALLTVLMLLSQTVPLLASTGAVSEEKNCEMACCATACACMTEGEEAPQPSSSGLPPAAGRDLVPQVTWVEAGSSAPSPQSLSDTRGRTTRPALDEHAPARTHVRLTVLFCSLLT